MPKPPLVRKARALGSLSLFSLPPDPVSISIRRALDCNWHPLQPTTQLCRWHKLPHCAAPQIQIPQAFAGIRYPRKKKCPAAPRSESAHRNFRSSRITLQRWLRPAFRRLGQFLASHSANPPLLPLEPFSSARSSPAPNSSPQLSPATFCRIFSWAPFYL